jgi:hypothetical protein
VPPQSAAKLSEAQANRSTSNSQAEVQHESARSAMNIRMEENLLASALNQIWRLRVM